MYGVFFGSCGSKKYTNIFFKKLDTIFFFNRMSTLSLGELSPLKVIFVSKRGRISSKKKRLF